MTNKEMSTPTVVPPSSSVSSPLLLSQQQQQQRMRGSSPRSFRPTTSPVSVPLSPMQLSSSSPLRHGPPPYSPVGGRGGAGGRIPLSPNILNNSMSFPSGDPGAESSSSYSSPYEEMKRRAMESAIQKERIRIKEMEATEADLTADELRNVLKRERVRMARLAGDLACMKSITIQSIAEAEVHEEHRINNLMRKLESLQQEKGRIIVELEREEEMLTNNLQKKLEQVRKEKFQLEQQVEHEQFERTKLKTKLIHLKNYDDNVDFHSIGCEGGLMGESGDGNNNNNNNFSFKEEDEEEEDDDEDEQQQQQQGVNMVANDDKMES